MYLDHYDGEANALLSTSFPEQALPTVPYPQLQISGMVDVALIGAHRFIAAVI